MCNVHVQIRLGSESWPSSARAEKWWLQLDIVFKPEAWSFRNKRKVEKHIISGTFTSCEFSVCITVRGDKHGKPSVAMFLTAPKKLAFYSKWSNCLSPSSQYLLSWSTLSTNLRNHDFFNSFNKKNLKNQSVFDPASLAPDGAKDFYANRNPP